jgi:hypothetical protein
MITRDAKYIAMIIAMQKHNQNQIVRLMLGIIPYFLRIRKRKDDIFYIARNKYPRRIIHLRYAPTVFDALFLGTDISERCPTSRYSFD